MKAFIKLLLLALLFFGCHSSKVEDRNQLLTFNLKELPKVSNVKLSDLGFTDIEYFPLETNEHSFITFTDNVFGAPTPPINIVSGEGFYLILQGNTILRFRDNGSFVTKIGTEGRGPNEFTVAHDVEVNSRDRNIYLVDGWLKKFNVYSEDGEFKRTFKMPLYAQVDFRFVDNNILSFCENHMGNIENSYTLLDTNGLVIKSFPNKYPFKNRDGFMLRSENLFYEFNNQLFKKEAYSDTIYVWDKMDFKPHFVIESGKKLVTPDVRSNFDGRYIVKNFIQQLSLFEFGDYVYYDFIYKFELPDVCLTYGFISSKKNNYQALFNRSVGIINDLDGGPNILPRTIKDDNTIIALVDAIQFKTYVSLDNFKKSIAKYPEKKKDLEKLANSMKETDNPVLVLVRLKK